MKTVIRPKSFETNSSSEHALVWSKSYDMSKASDVHRIPAGSFGWGYEVYTEPEDRISYIRTAFESLYYNDPISLEAWRARLVEVLELPNDVVFELDGDNWGWGSEAGSIDHVGECAGLVEALAEDDEMLRAFAYGEGKIECGNDNDGWPSDHWMESPDFGGDWDDDRNEWIPPKYPWEEVVEYGDGWLFIKGN